VPDPVEDDVADTPEIDPGHFRQVLGHFASGVTIITGLDGERPVGLAVGSFFSVSLAPALVGFCPSKTSSSWPVIRAAGRFCVNVLGEGQEALSRRFATPGVDRFGGVGWSPTARGGSPRLAEVLAWIDCEVADVHDAGDHEICVARVLDLDVADRSGPLIYYRGGYGRFEP
jgi:3-hydroxy-9,10-secoandrosta-1,3,5(10)-triene-9,17-dione monooxygenase reductase component